MTRPIVRCRCGHRVLAKEVLRTDLYERPSGREYVYVKFRCKRCKRLGETFVAESRWDWRIFEAARSEMSDAESETFAAQAPICAEDILAFHRQLEELESIEQAIELSAELTTDAAPADESTPSAGGVPEGGVPKSRSEVSRSEAKRDFKTEIKADHKKAEHKNEAKSEPTARPGETGNGTTNGDDAPRRHRPPRDG
jgi:hypothetical protein